MTDETGRRNYSKYNRYLTVLEMDVADGADKAAGGECEDGKGVASKKVVGSGLARKRRATAVVSSNSNKIQIKQQQQQTGGTAKIAGGHAKAVSPNRNQQQQNMTENNDVKSSLQVAGGNENRSKTVWKCKKCFFR